MIKLLNIVFILNLIWPLQLLADTAKPLVLEDSRSSYLLKDYLIVYEGVDNFNFLNNADKFVDNQQNLHLDSIDQTQKYLWGYFDIKNNSKKHLNRWINFCNNDYVTGRIECETYKT